MKPWSLVIAVLAGVAGYLLVLSVMGMLDIATARHGGVAAFLHGLGRYTSLRATLVAMVAVLAYLYYQRLKRG